MFWIDFDPPFTRRVEKLAEFAAEHELLGELDKRYIKQLFAALDAEPSMKITKIRIGARKIHKATAWTLRVTINFRKEFSGESEELGEALLYCIDNLCDYIRESA